MWTSRYVESTGHQFNPASRRSVRKRQPGKAISADTPASSFTERGKAKVLHSLKQALLLETQRTGRTLRDPRRGLGRLVGVAVKLFKSRQRLPVSLSPQLRKNNFQVVEEAAAVSLRRVVIVSHYDDSRALRTTAKRSFRSAAAHEAQCLLA